MLTIPSSLFQITVRLHLGDCLMYTFWMLCWDVLYYIVIMGAFRFFSFKIHCLVVNMFTVQHCKSWVQSPLGTSCTIWRNRITNFSKFYSAVFLLKIIMRCFTIFDHCIVSNYTETGLRNWFWGQMSRS
jgi:hypothetical protein